MQACPSGHDLYCPSHSCCLLQTPFKQMYPDLQSLVLLQICGTVHDSSSQTSPLGHILYWLHLCGGLHFLLLHFHPLGQFGVLKHVISGPQIPKSHFLELGQSLFDVQIGKQCPDMQIFPSGHNFFGLHFSRILHLPFKQMYPDLQ